jgi:hypothetical protein
MGRGRVESGLPMKTKTHFAFRIDIRDDTGGSIVLGRLGGIEPAEFFRSQVHRREALLRQRPCLHCFHREPFLK